MVHAKERRGAEDAKEYKLLISSGCFSNWVLQPLSLHLCLLCENPKEAEEKTFDQKPCTEHRRKFPELPSMEREQLLADINAILDSLSDKALEDLLTFLNDIITPPQE